MPSRKPTNAAGVGAYRALESFAVPGPDFPRLVQTGDLIGENDPLVKTHGALLQPVAEYVESRIVGAPVEQATAGPGEVRGLVIPSGVTNESGTVPRDTRSGARGETPADPDAEPEAGDEGGEPEPGA